VRSVSDEPGGWGLELFACVPWVFTLLARGLACPPSREGRRKPHRRPVGQTADPGDKRVFERGGPRACEPGTTETQGELEPPSPCIAPTSLCRPPSKGDRRTRRRAPNSPKRERRETLGTTAIPGNNSTQIVDPAWKEDRRMPRSSALSRGSVRTPDRRRGSDPQR